MSIPPAPVHEGMVEQAALTTLQAWMRTYLGFAESWYGYDPEALPDPASYVATDSVDLDRWPEDQIPCVIVHCAGHADTPTNRGDSYGATWDLRVGVVVSAADEDSTRDMARVYSAAVRCCLDFHGLTGLEGTVRWMGGVTDPPDEIKRRTIAGSRVDFQIDVPTVLQRDDVPAQPLPDPPDGGRPDYPDTPTAEHVQITVNTLEE